MAQITDCKALEKSLSSSTPAPFYFISSGEQYDIREALGIIKKAVIPNQTGDNYVSWRLCPVTANEITSAAQMITFTGGNRLVVASDIELTKKALGNKFEEIFEQYFSNPNPTTTVVFAFNTTVSKKSGDNTAFNFIKKLATKHGVVAEFKGSSDTDITKAMVSAAAAGGCELEIITAKYLYECCSGNKDMIFNELNKLCAAKQAGKITTNDVDKYCAKTLEANVLEIFDAIAKGNADAVFGMLATLKTTRTEPIAILGALSNSFCMYYLAKTAKAQGISATELKNRVGISENYAKFLLSSERKFGEQFLTYGVRICADAGYSLVSAPGDRYLILEHALLKIMCLKVK